jgi:chorismate dehydratase
MKVGYINYLNSYPFYYHMLEKAPVPGVEIVPGHPGELNKMMKKGKLDLSPISAAACAEIQEGVILLPDFCIGSIGYVRSVILISRLPIEDLNGKRVGLTIASQTSVALLKALLKKYYHIEPLYTPVDPSPSLKNIDAALIIGNEAMINSREAIPYTYDLGDLWFRKTGYPVVFAVFTILKSALEKYPSEIKAIIRSYHTSLKCLATEKNELIQKAAEKYPEITHDISGYYDLLEYRFTEELKSALIFYFSVTAELGLLKEVKSLDFMS